MFGKERSPFAKVVTAALEETRQRGDRRLGTEHLLLGLLHDPDSPTARALGVRVADARAALDALDQAALKAIGIDVGVPPKSRPRKHPAVPGTALTTSARAAINQAVKATTLRTRDTAPNHLLLVLLAQSRPDPVAELLDELRIDRPAIRARLT
ncbi:Clp protease N-terminal domain-containing protein [Nonomuraea sp. NPDC000554]|uniref:Clp protease N-terminal domain-containing protein n=1 Tax=Nonomuraea sp. NPDC000554 TaxID=3154259 RepID=UPI00331E9BF5